MIDLQKALSIATDTAKEAGKRIAEGFEEPVSFTLKTDLSDRLTQVDLDAQKIVHEKLTEAFPEIGFLGEEEDGSETDGSHDARWVVDPLDGTMNFTHKLPFCGTSIALEQDGEHVLGVIHFPMLGWTYAAVKGEGATKNGKKIQVSNCQSFKDALISEIFSDRESRGQKVDYPASTGFRKFGSAVTSAALVAEGAVDGTVIRCARWDIAAAEIIITEAGGTVSITEDEPGNPRTALTFVASAPGIHQELKTLK